MTPKPRPHPRQGYSIPASDNRAIGRAVFAVALWFSFGLPLLGLLGAWR